MDPSFLMDWKTLLEENNRGKRGHTYTTYDQFFVTNGERVFGRQDNAVLKIKKNITTEYENQKFIDILTEMRTIMTYLPINIFRSNRINVAQVKRDISKVRSFSHIYMMAQATINGGGYITPNICVHQRTENSNAKPSVFLKNLPETFSFIFDKFNIDSQFRISFFKNLKKESFSLGALLYLTAKLKIVS